MWSFQAGSSPVDWCEDNYAVSPYIAEFVNAISNIPFLIGCPLLMHLFRGYGKLINPGIHIIWILLMVVGISSTYFHATLSLAGQMLDELAILWVYFAAFAMFFPRRQFPHFFHGDRKKFSVASLLMAVTGTVFAILYPAINAFVLMNLGIPSVLILIREVKREKNERINRLAIRCASFWLLAVFCWLNDRILCETWSAIKFPYLHAFWHVFIFVTCYTGCALFAYFSVRDEHPEKTAVLMYWPRNDCEFCVPYIHIKIINSKGDI